TRSAPRRTSESPRIAQGAAWSPAARLRPARLPTAFAPIETSRESAPQTTQAAGDVPVPDVVSRSSASLVAGEQVAHRSRTPIDSGVVPLPGAGPERLPTSPTPSPSTASPTRPIASAAPGLRPVAPA